MILSSFILKIIAMVCMTIDHIGVFNGSEIFRIIGRIALPIYIFLLFEGCRRTRDIKKYMLRLLIMSAFMYIACFFAVIVERFPSGSATALENIFLSEFFCVFSYYLFFGKLKNKREKCLILIPIIFFVGSYAYELATINVRTMNSILNASLDGLACMYSIFVMIMFYLLCLFNYIYEKIVKKAVKNDDELFNEYVNKNKKAQFSRNCLMSISIVIVALICHAITYIDIPGFSFGSMARIKTYICLAIPPILMYSGRKGPCPIWFKYGCYLYFPIHIGIIALIFMLI